MPKNKLSDIFNAIVQEFKDHRVDDALTVGAVTAIGAAMGGPPVPVLLGASMLGAGSWRIMKGIYKGIKNY